MILHPTTPAATRIVAQNQELRPEHILSYDITDSYAPSFADIEELETVIIDKDGERVGQSSSATAEIALRFTNASMLKKKSNGFVFGRNGTSSDIIFGQDSGRRISNQHFRIFINQFGVTMLQDMSTNGTVVDSHLLRSKDVHYNKARMLIPGSMITIPNSNKEEVITFSVRVPSRGPYKERYEENKQAFESECATGDSQDRALLDRRPFRATMKWDGGENYNIIGVSLLGASVTMY
jgi:hypothetical protein